MNSLSEFVVHHWLEDGAAGPRWRVLGRCELRSFCCSWSYCRTTVTPRWQPSRVRLGDLVDCAPGREVTLTGDDGRVVCVAGTVPGSRFRELAAVMADEDLRSSGALRWLE